MSQQYLLLFMLLVLIQTQTKACPVNADFTSTSTHIRPNDALLFNNISSNANSYEWIVDGTIESTVTHFSRIFSTSGTYVIELVAINLSCGSTTDTMRLNIQVSPTGLVRGGLPVYPLAVGGSVPAQTVDWQNIPPITNQIPTTNTNGGQTGAGYDQCGNLAFYALHTGSVNSNNLFIYAADGSPLLTNTTTNAPGLNSMRGGQEMQVIKVPQTLDEWYIIYKEWRSNSGAIVGNASYNPTNWLVSRIRYSVVTNVFTVLTRDQPLVDGGGVSHTYTDGAAVSRTLNGDPNQHYLYLCRRTINVNTISLDRFIINNTGVTFDANTGNITNSWWSLGAAGSPIELSPTEDRIAVVSRNQNDNTTDFTIFDAVAFNNVAIQPLVLGDLILQPDGGPNDQSSVLGTATEVDVLGTSAATPLRFLANMERKASQIEFSPSGQYLYFTGGGYSASGITFITYLGQIDLDASPLALRLQIQTTPTAPNMTNGRGCPFSTCLAQWYNIGTIESSFDGNLYFTKRNRDSLFVIPSPNTPMPQNLVPSNINLETVDEPNIGLSNTAARPGSLPDQIDGFNYLDTRFSEVNFISERKDCNGNCDVPYAVEVIDTNTNLVVQTFIITQCPDTITFCADTTLTYSLREPTSGITYTVAIDSAAIVYPDFERDTLFDFSYIIPCPEICGNGIDDNGNGLIDHFDTLDCPCTVLSCNSPTYNICDDCSRNTSSTISNWAVNTVWQSTMNINPGGFAMPVVGDIDGDCFPEVIFSENDTLYALDGQTGQTKYKNSSLRFAIGYAGNLAIADVDEDGLGDIFLISDITNPVGQRQKLIRLEYDGVSGFNQVFESTDAIGPYTNYDPTAGRRYHFMSINLADINQDGRPEVIIGNEVFDAITGDLIVAGPQTGALGSALAWGGSSTNYGRITTGSVLVDVLPDDYCINCKGLELVAGNMIYAIDIPNGSGLNSGTMTIEVTNNTIADGFTSVADLDFDGNLEIITGWGTGTANRFTISAWNPLTGTTYDEFTLGIANSIGLGRIAIADLDNAFPRDLELAFHIHPSLYSYKFNPTTKTFSPLANIAVSDRSRTGVTVFDFDGDGANEVIYRDESTLRLLSGGTLTSVIAPLSCTSGTDVEYPIVADVNGDGQTEILIACGNKMRLYGNGQIGEQWVPSRKVWNQWSYFYTNINDDLTIPREQQKQHLVEDSLLLNSFLKQYGDPDFPLPDANIQITSTLTVAPDSVDITVQICNIGSNILPANTPITFYNGNPTTTTAVPIAAIEPIGSSVEAGNCIVQTYRVLGASADVYAVINCDNSITPVFDFNTDFPMTTINECDYTNNMANETILLSADWRYYNVEKYNQSQSQIKWELHQPSNYNSIEIERSGNAEPFKTIANAINPSKNEYFDQYPLEGNNYYRLKLFHQDGTYSYTNIKHLYFESNSIDLVVAPNPFDEKLVISLTSKVNASIQAIELINILGQTILTKKISSQTNIELPLEQLPQGAYWLRVKVGEQWLKRKIIKQ